MISLKRLKLVVFSFMVPVHTNFAPDTLFAHIAARFYKNYVFNTAKIVAVAAVLGTNVYHVQPKTLRRCKLDLTGKYRNVPRITEWNIF